MSPLKMVKCCVQSLILQAAFPSGKAAVQRSPILELEGGQPIVARSGV